MPAAAASGPGQPAAPLVQLLQETAAADAAPSLLPTTCSTDVALQQGEAPGSGVQPAPLQQLTEQPAHGNQHQPQLVLPEDAPTTAALTQPATAAGSCSSSRRSSSWQGGVPPQPHTLPRRRHCTSHENAEQQQACALASARAELAAARALAAHQEQQLSAEAHELQQLHAQLPATKRQLLDAQARLHAASARLAAARHTEQAAQHERAHLASLHRQLPRERRAAAATLHRAHQALGEWEREEVAADAELQEAEAVADTWRRRFNRAVIEHRPAARTSPRSGGGSWLARVPFFGGLEATVDATMPHRSPCLQ